MDAKKSDRANLENKRTIFLQSGFVIVLSLILIAFEWSSELHAPEVGGVTWDPGDEIMTPITFVKPEPKPEPKRQTIEELIIKDNDVEETKDVDFNTEITEEDPVTLTEIYEPEPEDDNVLPFYSIEEKPAFPDGDIGLLRYLSKNTKYPEQAKEAGISGRVYVSFVIDKTGKVIDVKLARSVHPLLDNEALRVVKSLPDWTPGKQRGKPVKVSFSVPISFVLN